MYPFPATALRNLTESGNLFEGSMKNLRHLAWTVKERKDEPQLVLLREQNSVLREVVKNLKRKVGISDFFFFFFMEIAMLLRRIEDLVVNRR